MPSAASYKIDDYETLLVALQNVFGVVVSEEQRSSLVERIQPLLELNKLDSLARLAEMIRGSNNELRADVLDVISQRQPDWSLNAETSKILHQYVFSQLPENARIWIVGCGQGQLAYMVAMEIAEYDLTGGESKKFQIIATDVSGKDIEQAKTAAYSHQQLLTLNDKFKETYIKGNGAETGGTVKDKIRQQVEFSRCNLVDDFKSMGHVDLIICPKVLVYFSNGIKAGILQQFAGLLKSGGIFLAGSHQSIPADIGLERVEHPAGVFYRQKN